MTRSAKWSTQANRLTLDEVAKRHVEIMTIAMPRGFELRYFAELDFDIASFCAELEMGELKQITKVLKMEVPIASGRPWSAAEVKANPKPKQQQRRGGRLQGKGRRPQRRAA